MNEPKEHTPDSSPSPDDWLNIREIMRELRCSYEHVRSLFGKRGGPILLAHFQYNGKLWSTRQAVAAYKANVVSRGVMRNRSRRA